MSVLRRVVFDTGTLVSAALRDDSVPQRALAHALSAGEVCGADALISSDADLQVLHPWNGVPILTPAAYVSQAGA